MSSQETEHSRWFSDEVQPHEPALRAYLQSRFPQLSDAEDVIQETYSRVWRQRMTGSLRHVRAFMFTAARNIALDFFRRHKHVQLEPITQNGPIDVIRQAPSAAETINRQQELDLLAEAVQTLPHRCRQVIMLRYLKGCSYKEIAEILGVSPETVKTHIAKGVALCTEFFAQRGLLDERRTP